MRNANPVEIKDDLKEGKLYKHRASNKTLEIQKMQYYLLLTPPAVHPSVFDIRIQGEVTSCFQPK